MSTNKVVNEVWSEKDVIYLLEHFRWLKYKDIGRIIGKTERQIIDKLSSLGLKKRVYLRTK